MVLPAGQGTAAVSSWAVLLDLTRAAPDCENQAVDGVSFAHDLRGGDVRVTAVWTNPTRDVDARQFALVAAYRELLAATGLVKHRRVL